VNESGRHQTRSLFRLEQSASSRSLLWALGCSLCLTCLAAHGGPLVSTASPIGFFTNVANRLLQTQLNLSLNRIQLYPTNQYTPSVHRLLQVTANLYDASTNRTFNLPAATNGFPSVFRPVFASLNNGNQVFITGYQEVNDASVLLSLPVLDLTLLGDRKKVGREDQMIWGVPLVIGAKKGLPNFNKFSAQTQVQVTRKLQFHRPGTSNTAPVNEIDQMFVVGITNMFGVEAWNSYATTFPRDLRLVVIPELSVALDNLETGKLLNPASSRYVLPPVVTNIAANTWWAYNPAHESISFVLPLTSATGVPYTNHVVLTNATYSASLDIFVPLTGNFERSLGTSNLYVPHWQLNVRTRLRCALIETSTSPNRIADYVNLDSTESPLNIADALMHDTLVTYSCDPQSTTYTPSASNGSMWCTNRQGALTDNSVPTFGVRNQIEASLGQTSPDWNNSKNEFPAGMNKADAIAFFRGQFTPGYLHQSNTFNAPFQPFRNMYIITEWEANDPLVHYTISDLNNLQRTNSYYLDNPDTKLVNLLGHVNRRYEPWGGNPKQGAGNVPAYDLTVKDPVPRAYGRSDDWDFPTNNAPNLGALGRVHRGTPWQTLYLKAPGTSLSNWMRWTGNTQLLTNWNGNDGLTYDAFFSQPTNDWRLASLLVSLLNTNDPRTLRSVNQTSTAAWCGLLDGMIVLTNNLPDDQLPYAPSQFAAVIMSSNSPQASTIASALFTAGASQPDQHFHDVGDILATPELSAASPWLNLSSPEQLDWGLSDEAYEAIPSQLLPLLRPDSIGYVSQNGGTLQVQFSGSDGYAYAVQSSSNLLSWTPVSTNYPANGFFNFTDSPALGSPRRYYRSLLLP
jgi:hypothetical protein